MFSAQLRAAERALRGVCQIRQTAKSIVGLARNQLRGWPANDGAAIGPIKAIKCVKSVKFIKPSPGLLDQAKRGLTNLTDLTRLTGLGAWKKTGRVSFGAPAPLGSGGVSEPPHFLDGSQGPSPARSVIGGPGVTDNRPWVALYQSSTPLGFAGPPASAPSLPVGHRPGPRQACPRRRQRRRRCDDDDGGDGDGDGDGSLILHVHA